MNEPKINLLEDFSKKEIKPSIIKTKGSRIFILLKVFFIILIATFVFFSNTIFSNSSILQGSFGPFPQIGFSKIWIAFKGYVLGKHSLLKGEVEDRINILLLGMGGAGHEGPYLTDTIILASIKPSTGKVALVSIPRDLYVPIPKYGWRKINNANAFGEAENPGQGGIITSQTVGNILDLPIHYYVRINFEGFEKIIDDLGKIDVFVEKSFIDHQYPAPDFQYQTISFAKGWQKMNGDQALKFARSRSGTNGESSDFARAKRQQKILLGIKNKALSFSTLISPQKISKIIQNLEKSIKTNLELEQIVKLIKIVEKIKTDDITNFTLSDDPDNFLISDITLDGAFILRPKTGNFKDIAFFVNHIFEQPTNISSFKEMGKEKETSQPAEKVKLFILNGTKQEGLAKIISESFETLGFSVPRIANAPRQDYEKTVIYNLNKDDEEALSLLKEKLKANISSELPDFLEQTIHKNETFDFLIVLGMDNIN